MKKSKLVLLAAVAALPLLQSCNDDAQSIAYIWASVQPLTNSDYYFKLDNGQTAYPGDKSRIGNYEATEGQRAILYYQKQDRIAEGYHYNFKLFAIDNILTKAPKTIDSQEELEAVGDDQIDILSLRISGGYLDIHFKIGVTSESKHELNLIVNHAIPATTTDADGYTMVEFRHKAHGATSAYYSEDLVSFRLGDLDPAVTGSKGLCIRVRTITHGIEEIRYIKVKPIDYGKN